MRDLFFKTTQARHPSALLRFVYSFLRLRQQSVFFVRPRSKFSLFFRLQILRKLFVWFYTDKFARRAVFQRLIRVRSSTFRTFLNFCTTLETYIPVILYRLHFVENMRNAFLAIRTGLVFKNGRRIIRPDSVLRLGDFVELFFDDTFKILGFNHLIKCLPTLRFRLTLRDSIVNTAVFYSLFVQNYTFLAFSERNTAASIDLSPFTAETKYFNPMFLEKAFVSFFYSRVFLELFRFEYYQRFRVFYPFICRSKERSVFQSSFLKGNWSRLRALWWYAPIALGLGRAWAFLGMDSKESYFAFPFSRLFGSQLSLERDNFGVPDFLANSLESHYGFASGTLVLR